MAFSKALAFSVFTLCFSTASAFGGLFKSALPTDAFNGQLINKTGIKNEDIKVLIHQYCIVNFMGYPKLCQFWFH